MHIHEQDKTGQPRSNQELIDAQVAIKNDFVRNIPTPIMVHYPTISDAIDQLLALRKYSDVYEHLLKNLLAIIHRDGGHYTEAHGIHKSLEDAVQVIADERTEGHR